MGRELVSVFLHQHAQRRRSRVQILTFSLSSIVSQLLA